MDEEITLSPRERERLRRRHLLWLASILTGIFVILIAWAKLRTRPVPPPVGISPALEFEARCRTLNQSGKEVLHVTDFEVTDEMAQQVKYLDQVETLIFDRGRVSDRAINAISAMPRLRHLRLRHSPITDEGLKTLAQCETLWYINLPHVDCTPEGLAALAQLPRLRQLRIGSSELGNDAAAAIASIETLRGVHLIGVAVTDEGLKRLATLPHLESLYLDDAKVTDAGWSWLFRNYPEIHVHVDQHHHDRDPKKHVHHD